MNRSETLTLKIINAGDVLDSFPKERPLSESQKELIRMVAREAVQEYIREGKASSSGNRHDRIIRMPELTKLIGIGSSSIYKHIKDGNFPKPFKLGIRSVGWKESQITAWLEQNKKG